ncbi:MAG TPA: hypothetical protein VIM16_16295 [Mucilaginibacter sp.]
MRKILLILFAGVILYSSCSKQHMLSPVKGSFKITVRPTIADIANSTWQQVLGGEAIIAFNPLSADTLSAVRDSLSLANVAGYSKQVFAGTYNITLNTESKAVADTFIRFNSAINTLTINQDQAISFPATTNDGVVTISKSLIDTTVVPTFTPAGSATVLKFGKAYNDYFIYVTGNTTGRISFVEATTGYTYLHDLTVSAMNQYDLSPIINPTGVFVRLHPFQPKANNKNNL